MCKNFKLFCIKYGQKIRDGISFRSNCGTKEGLIPENENNTRLLETMNQATCRRSKVPLLGALFVCLLFIASPSYSTTNTDTNSGTKISDTNFMEFCLKGMTNEVKAAIESGVNVNIKDGDLWTPLMYATISKNPSPEIVAALIEAGADVNADVKGITVLMRAVGNYKQEIVLLLINAGANVNAKEDTYGATAMMYAALSNPNNSAEVISLLITAGADVNAKDNRGHTALMYTSQLHADPDAILLLLKAGADAKTINNSGKRAIDLIESPSDFQNTEVYRQLEAASK
ncbi:MAG: ankyrin repeat domain-containing protein [Fusobacteriaceae bacterium]|jgi:ankyrin repeat protein|nr:ankyrin repeat domain-containing protein [Fusobacteriaceae bacterium]